MIVIVHLRRRDVTTPRHDAQDAGPRRREPDPRGQTEGAGLETLLPLQARFLASAARLVKPGGRLVYATCSLLGEENETWAKGFLAAHPGFRVVPAGEVAGTAVGAGMYLSLTPGRDGTDGFFGAVVEREGMALLTCPGDLEGKAV